MDSNRRTSINRDSNRGPGHSSNSPPIKGGLPSGRMGRQQSVSSKRHSHTLGYLTGRLNDPKEPKWSCRDYTPPRYVTDEELAQAKVLFFQLDRDSSGSIDKGELAFALRSLGQTPSEKDITDIINEYDKDVKDGHIQLREFLKMYTHALDSATDSRVEDVTDCFRALDANPRDDNATVKKATFEAYMQENFDLELDSDAVFASGAANSTLCLDDFKRLLMPDSEKGRSKGK